MTREIAYVIGLVLYCSLVWGIEPTALAILTVACFVGAFWPLPTTPPMQEGGRR